MVAPAQAGDSDPPQVRLLAPQYASQHSRDGRFALRWRGRDVGTGIARYRLEVRRNAIVTPRWRTLATTSRTRAGFHGRAGITYLLRIRARDRAGNLSVYQYAETSVPFDDRNPGLRADRGWWAGQLSLGLARHPDPHSPRRDRAGLSLPRHPGDADS